MSGLRPNAVMIALVAMVGAACARGQPPEAIAARAAVAIDHADAEVSDAEVSDAEVSGAGGSRDGSGEPVTGRGPEATSTDAPAADSVAAPEPAPPRWITMAFTGDILPHSPLWRQARRNAAAAGVDGYDFGPMLAGLTPLLESVDLAVCHLETPIAPEGEAFSTAPIYGVPPEVIGAIADAGFERCSTASNHTADRGTAGVDRTVTLFEQHGLGQSGMARTPAEIEPAVIDVGGVAVTHLAYTFSYNGRSFPDGEEWRSALIDPERILGDAATARAEGAEIVVVSLHWGEEKIHEPTRAQREVAEALTAAGTIDLIVGHHAHVLQPIERVNGTWVVFGLGNVLSNMPTSFRWPDASQDAAVVTVEFEITPGGEVTVARPVAHPTWVDKLDGWRVTVVLDELARDDISDGRRDQLERSLARTESVVGDSVVDRRVDRSGLSP